VLDLFFLTDQLPVKVFAVAGLVQGYMVVAGVPHVVLQDDGVDENGFTILKTVMDNTR